MTLAESAAEKLLRSLAVEKPSDIDLEAIAWSVGVASICERPLDGCEARIVGRAGHAVISVKKGIRASRQRFSICHELGHWHHHKGQLLYCKTADMHQRAIAEAKEAVANRYASDLLLPPFMVRPMIAGHKAVDLRLLEHVSSQFRASFTATAIKLVRLIGTPSMVVCHGQAGRKWHVAGPGVPANWFPRADLDPRGPAFQMLYSGGREQASPRRTKASAWFERWDAERYELTEQSFRGHETEVVTILTMDDARMFVDLADNPRHR